MRISKYWYSTLFAHNKCFLFVVILIIKLNSSTTLSSTTTTLPTSVRWLMRNFVRFVGKYFSNSACTEQAGVSDMILLLESDLTGASMQFYHAYLSELFWCLYSQRPLNKLLALVTKVSLYENLETMVNLLLYFFYAFMLASLTVCPVGHFRRKISSFSADKLTTTTAAISAATSADPSNALGKNQKGNISRTPGLILQYLCLPDSKVSYLVSYLRWGANCCSTQTAST